MDKELLLSHLKNRLEDKYIHMLDVVYQKLLNVDYNYYSKTKSVLVFSRYDHTLRVLMWAIRIYDNNPNKDSIDFESLVISTIFHDIGYYFVDDLDNHGKYSAEFAKEYLEKNNYQEEKINFISYLISNHSNKKMLEDNNTEIELIILMEADLFDETGAFSIIEDGIYLGRIGETDFFEAYNRFMGHSYFSLDWNPMVTDYSRKMWEEKAKLLMEFNKQLLLDLGVEEDEED